MFNWDAAADPGYRPDFPLLPCRSTAADMEETAASRITTGLIQPGTEKI